VGTFQGPIKLAYGLADVVIATAGSVERINNVDVNISKNIVDELNMKIHKRLVEEN
jgi:membrane protein YdbS with pleckstrin-like domain